MTHWSFRQVLALLLTVFVTLSISLSLVHASGMAGNMTTDGMTMTPAMGVSAHDDCTGGAPDARKAKPMACLASCVAPASATLPLAISTPLAILAVMRDLPDISLPDGSRSPLDPYPPRSSSI